MDKGVEWAATLINAAPETKKVDGGRLYLGPEYLGAKKNTDKKEYRQRLANGPWCSVFKKLLGVS